VGEIGLAAVSFLLEANVSKVEHNKIKYTDFNRFFSLLFAKA
jgi:hypothetical protein